MMLQSTWRIATYEQGEEEPHECGIAKFAGCKVSEHFGDVHVILAMTVAVVFGGGLLPSAIRKRL
jgi:hypothetical protein